MVNPKFYSLLGEGPVPTSWFEAQLSRYDTRSDILRDAYLSPEINALKDFHDGNASPEQAAQAITRPITTSSVPSVGTSSDEIVAVTQLWRLYKDALVEWPSSRTRDLIQLGAAISKSREQLHRGEALNEDDPAKKPLAWEDLPGFGMVWRDAHWQQPIDLVEKCKSDDERKHARDVYLKEQDVEAQLVSKDLMQYKLAFRAVITDLEVAKKPEERGNHDPAKDGDFESLELDFHIPAAARWIKHSGQRMYVSIVEKGLKDLDENDIPRGAKHFDKAADRWQYWKQRFEDVLRDAPDDFTKGEAHAAIDTMEAIEGRG